MRATDSMTFPSACLACLVKRAGIAPRLQPVVAGVDETSGSNAIKPAWLSTSGSHAFVLDSVGQVHSNHTGPSPCIHCTSQGLPPESGEHELDLDHSLAKRYMYWKQ